MEIYINQIEDYIRCSYQYYLKHIKKAPQKLTIKQLMGKIFRKIVYNDFEAQKINGEFLDQEIIFELLDKLLYEELANRELKGFFFNDIIKIRMKLGNILSQYNYNFGFLKETFKSVKEINAKENIKINDDIILTNCDILTNKYFIHFILKSNIDSYNYKHDVRLLLNSYIWKQKKIKGIAIVLSEKDTNNFPVKCNERDYDDMKNIIENVMRGIKNNIFYPCKIDENYLCKYCMVNNDCKFYNKEEK